MSVWSVEPGAIQTVLTNTQTAADTISTALGGSPVDSPGPRVEGVGGVADDMVQQSQSGLIGTALSGFFDDRQAAMSLIMDRIIGSMNATAEAVREILNGHDDIAQNTHGRIGAAEQADARAAAGGAPGDGQAILHGPDQVAGGRPDTYDGLGSTNINGSIGSQWRSRVGDLQADIAADTSSVPPDLLHFIHMNIRLTS